MEEIRNSNGKLICLIDKPKRTVEIAVKGCITTIRFEDNGEISVENTERKIN